MVPNWLRDEVLTGLQKLLALRLVGTPPEDAIAGTAQVWIEAMDRPGIEWIERLDRPRVQRAFRALFATCERWPVPKLFIAHLGNRDPPKALAEPPMTPEQIARNRERLREMIASLSTRHQYCDKGHSK